MLSFFPRGVLDEILNLIESVSEGFPSYFYLTKSAFKNNFSGHKHDFCMSQKAFIKECAKLHEKKKFWD